MSFYGGSYKLSEYQLMRLISKGEHGASSFEIDTMLYLSQICDEKGVINRFRISELKHIIGCSLRESYYILSNLEKKGFLSVSCHNKNGYRELTLVKNNFHGVTDYRKNRYLNVNRCFLNPLSPDFRLYQNLSLFAKKLLLYILYQYSSKRGFRFKFRQAAKALHIKNESLIACYLNELKPLLIDDELISYMSKESDGKYDMCFIKQKSTLLTPNSGLSAFQPSYVRYQLQMMFDNIRKQDIPISDEEGNRITKDSTALFDYYISSLSSKVVFMKQKCEHMSLDSILTAMYEYIMECQKCTYKQVLDFAKSLFNYYNAFGPDQDIRQFFIF